jgi:hypothetical protein
MNTILPGHRLPHRNLSKLELHQHHPGHTHNEAHYTYSSPNENTCGILFTSVAACLWLKPKRHRRPSGYLEDYLRPTIFVNRSTRVHS